ncbi:carbohydrate ABC transporter membrane protein 2, CUT1 family [Thermomonospora echinospora]|uniref:Carbohydrate ABC transporter membrane protein 2, CUT1 family n=1 Tax=Thermomonospora echinospora TaxID=1992 RepID=A0A1H6B1B1_9ACTN|nr:carbohydrate ABC transporter permease [Thermomonospora echinospora]SEG54390.1 carbohydrate ABC transporter membrane protein 2, CUT1 family [Thermomonospora echinospora]
MSRRLLTALLAPVAVLMAVPLVYIVSLSLRSRDDVLNGGLLPSEVFWRNWPDTFGAIDLPRHLANSWVVAAGAVALTLAIAVPAAHYTARARRSGERLLSLVLASYCAPPVVAVLPLFYLLRTTGLNNTLAGLVLVTGLANVPVAVWLLDGFVRRVPQEIEEAAWLDGLGGWGVLRHVIAPLIAPGIVASGLICFFLGYNELLFALSFAQETSVQTLPVALSLFQGDRNIQFGRQAVASIVGVAPVYVLALLAQRRLVAGLSAGAVK